MLLIREEILVGPGAVAEWVRLLLSLMVGYGPDPVQGGLHVRLEEPNSKNLRQLAWYADGLRDGHGIYLCGVVCCKPCSANADNVSAPKLALTPAMQPFCANPEFNP